MRMWSVCTSAWRYCVSGCLVALLAACAGPAQQQVSQQAAVQQLAAEPALCRGFRAAWVGVFKANVEALNQKSVLDDAAREPLESARDELQQAGIAESSCTRPYCMIQPLQGGQLDTYCGYRIAATSGDELYQWVPWSGQ